MSSTARLTLLVMGALAVTLILAAAISAAMDGGNALPSIAHQVAIRATAGGGPQPGGGAGQDAVPVPPERPATAAPEPEPTFDARQDEPELRPAGDQHGDRDGGGGDSGSHDGHGG